MQNSHSLQLLVGSTNPVKINAASETFQALFPDTGIICQGVSAPSGVAGQPMSEAETRTGAINRVRYCQQHRQADFYLAMEGGVDLFEQGPSTFAYVVIANSQRQSVGRSANLPLPAPVWQALQQGEELGQVMDRLFNTRNIKQQGGAIGLLTNGRESRESAYRQALTLAMAPFLYPELYEE